MSRTVTDLDLAAGQVMLHCPACGAREAADPAVLAGSPRIVCRNCGETWPAASGGRVPLSLPRPGASTHAPHSDHGPKGNAWAAKIAADRALPPEKHRPPYAAAAIGAMLFAALFLGGREAAVAALPDLAGLYAAIGLPVNRLGLAIEDVVAERTSSAAGVRLTLRGAIRNVSDEDLEVPPVMAEIGGPKGVEAGPYGFEPPVTTLAAKGTAPFVLRLDRSASDATAVTVRFRRPAEIWSPASAGAAPP